MIHSTSKWLVFQIKQWRTKQIFVRVNLKFKIKTYFCVRGATTPLNLYLYPLPTWIKYLKLLFKLRNYIKMFTEIWTKSHVVKARFYWFWIDMYIGYKFLSIVNEMNIKKSEMNLKKHIEYKYNEMFKIAINF